MKIELNALFRRTVLMLFLFCAAAAAAEDADGVEILRQDKEPRPFLASAGIEMGAGVILGGMGANPYYKVDYFGLNPVSFSLTHRLVSTLTEMISGQYDNPSVENLGPERGFYSFLKGAVEWNFLRFRTEKVDYIWRYNLKRVATYHNGLGVRLGYAHRLGGVLFTEMDDESNNRLSVQGNTNFHGLLFGLTFHSRTYLDMAYRVRGQGVQNYFYADFFKHSLDLIWYPLAALDPVSATYVQVERPLGIEYAFDGLLFIDKQLVLGLELVLGTGPFFAARTPYAFDEFSGGAFMNNVYLTFGLSVGYGGGL